MKHYRHKVDIEAQSIGKDAYGQEVNGWALVAQVWAKIEPNGGGESFESGEVKATGSYRIELWYRSDVTAGCRVKYGARIFEIENVENEGETNRKLILTCKETV